MEKPAEYETDLHSLVQLVLLNSESVISVPEQLTILVKQSITKVSSYSNMEIIQLKLALRSHPAFPKLGILSSGMLLSTLHSNGQSNSMFNQPLPPQTLPNLDLSILLGWDYAGYPSGSFSSIFSFQMHLSTPPLFKATFLDSGHNMQLLFLRSLLSILNLRSWYQGTPKMG
ncbi:hypothetical protein BT96DRAFT_255774 [Gymnopus androsaceus JB14]|uniref:Uncharacterized protein n=1 Tax=Gymnopus androsaceus JB14 TaxID=1447944 RepID=A0A6A4H788_9AGAR|nr:hypothetical protein BT96DRAFT_255774 [Gymnopus androsaceus JB14]